MKLLNISETGHRATSKECPLNNKNWTYKHWYELQYELYNKYGDINDSLIWKSIELKIQQITMNQLNKIKNDVILFYVVNKDVITQVS